MPRRQRALLDGGYYHLISRGNNRQFIFTRRRDFLFFKILIRRSKAKHSWRLQHYCLMSNHIHLLAKIDKASDMPKIMQFLLHGYARYYKHKYPYSGHLWQGRYKSSLIEKDSYLLQCGAYIERNPQRAGLESAPGTYLWSSYAHYAMGRKDTIVDESPVFEMISHSRDEEMRRRSYVDFVGFEAPYDDKLDALLIDRYF